MSGSNEPYVCAIWENKLTNLLLCLDNVGDITSQLFLQLLMQIPHPPLETRTLKASVSQPKSVEDFRLVLETFNRLLMHGVFKQLLSGGDAIRKDTARENNELPEVFTWDFKVEWDLLLAGVCGIKRLV